MKNREKTWGIFALSVLGFGLLAAIMAIIMACLDFSSKTCDCCTSSSPMYNKIALISSIVAAIASLASTSIFQLSTFFASKHQASQNKAYPIYKTLVMDDIWKIVQNGYKQNKFLIRVSPPVPEAKEMLKEKIYMEASKDESVHDIFVPSDFHLQTLNENLLHNQLCKYSKSHIIYVVDGNSANIFELMRIDKATKEKISRGKERTPEFLQSISHVSVVYIGE